ncbi:MAG: hypothetical protein PHR35_16785 [Kiritimatiellae bacterium]|nr:hypothetical protein [Kiritimatiellia bacterium]
MQTVQFNGWNAIRLANAQVELIVTRDVGPRILRFAYAGGTNVFAEFADQQGGTGEGEWMIRGGHRLWAAPEAKPWSYELDNVPYEAADEIENGVRVRQAPGPVTGLAKQMEIALAPDENKVTVKHTLTNQSRKRVKCAVWALSVMGPDGQAVIPLPAKIPHTERLTHNQNWSLWGYTDLSDPRWSLGRDCLLFRQDRSRGPNKIGIAHREKWVAYQREDLLFVKYFDFQEGADYPDGGVNFETFSNEQMLEIESLGPLVSLKPGESATHVEAWKLSRDVPRCNNTADVARYVRPLV